MNLHVQWTLPSGSLPACPLRHLSVYSSVHSLVNPQPHMALPSDGKSRILEARHACRYKCVIVLCDSQWCDPDLDSSNGIQMGLRDMLRIDSMLMMVQLNVRMLLEVIAHNLFVHALFADAFQLESSFCRHCLHDPLVRSP